MIDNDKVFQEAPDRDDVFKTLPEAPLSIHIDSYFKGFHIGFTKRSDETRVSTQVDGVTKLIEDLISKGFECSWNKETSNGHLKPQEIKSETKAPVCGIHGTEMVWKSGISKKTNQPYGFYSCPTRNADQSYCTYKPPKEVK